MLAATETISPCGRQCLQLKMADQVGPITFGRLLEYFGTPERILGATAVQLRAIQGVGQVKAGAIRRAVDAAEVDAEIERAAAAGARIISRLDDDYPEPLRHIPDPPICIYVLGRLERRDGVALAVVGSRRATHYGQEQARRFGYLLGRAGFTVVSGMARGIDSLAHRGALDAEGRTIAVLGNGLARVYPPENAELRDRIVEQGAVISELPMDAAEDQKNFPIRNRIIVGLSLGTLVVEAGRTSGALISARLATDYNRELFAVPGRIDSDCSVGTNALIRDGAAKLTVSLEDILHELGPAGESMKGEPQDPVVLPDNLDPLETQIVNALGNEERSLDALVHATGLSAAQLGGTITMLQLKGVVRQLPGSRIVLVGHGHGP